MSGPISIRSITYHPPQYIPTTHGPAGRKSHTETVQFTANQACTLLKITSARPQNCMHETVGRDSSVGKATRYGPDGQRVESRWGGEIFRTRPDWPWCQPSLLYIGYRVFFPGVKRLRCGLDHPHLSSVEGKERVELYIYCRLYVHGRL